MLFARGISFVVYRENRCFPWYSSTFSDFYFHFELRNLKLHNVSYITNLSFFGLCVFAKQNAHMAKPICKSKCYNSCFIPSMQFLQIDLSLYSTSSFVLPQIQHLFSTFFKRISFPFIKISKGVLTLTSYLSRTSIGIVILPNSSTLLITPFHFSLFLA